MLLTAHSGCWYVKEVVAVCWEHINQDRICWTTVTETNGGYVEHHFDQCLIICIYFLSHPVHIGKWCNNENALKRRCKHCMLTVIRWSLKFLPSRRPPSRGHGMAKNLMSWKRSLPLTTNPVWWGSMHAILSYRGNRHTNTPINTQTHIQTHKPTDITLHCATASLARSVMTTRHLPSCRCVAFSHSDATNIDSSPTANKHHTDSKWSITIVNYAHITMGSVCPSVSLSSQLGMHR